MQFLDVIKGRRSVRAYEAAPVEQSKIDAVLAAAQMAPSAGDLQAYAVVIVEETGTKERLAEAALGQDFIATAPVVLVFLADKARSKSKYGARGARLFAIQDATIAAAYAQLAAAAQGLGACWVGAFDDRRVAAAVAAPDHLQPVALMPLGRPAESPARTPRRAPSELVWREQCEARAGR